MKKTVLTVIALVLSALLVAPVFAETMPETLQTPLNVRAENLLAEEYQYRTLIYYDLPDDVMDILSTEPAGYGALTMDSRVYLQYSIDGGNWINFYFVGIDEEGKEYDTTAKKLTVTRHNSISVLSLIIERERKQLPEDVYYYDVEYPECSYLLTDTHQFRFRVRVELEWIDKESLTTMTASSDWSTAATVKTVVTEDMIPDELKLPIISEVTPVDSESGPQINVVAHPTRQITLIRNYFSGIGDSLLLEAELRANGGEWMPLTATASDINGATYIVPPELGLATADDVSMSNLEIHFRYRATARELSSGWTEEAPIGEYTDRGNNPDFDEPSFLMNEFLGVKVWVWMTIVTVIALGVIGFFILRRRRR